jgi:hexosaminidase
MSAFDALLPQPKRLERTGEPVRLPRELSILLDDSEGVAALDSQLREALEVLGVGVGVGVGTGVGAWSVSLRVKRLALKHRPQGYTLSLGPRGCEVSGDDEAGLFYGVCTLLQLLELHAPETPGGELELPALQIEDWPDFPSRGVMLDVSRDRVPTMETLLDLVDLLAGWKINQLQLYMEHTFAYRGHEAVWRDASPFSAEEIRALDVHCRQRHVELVPNQNSFGHFHRWLIHEPYRRLAECPEGIEHPFSPRPEPYGLCPTDPQALALLADLYDQLLPCFSSGQLNVGLDETLDLGRGRSAAACEAHGAGRVYVDFLRQVHTLVAERGRTMQFWSDIILKHPEQISALPPDAVALEWGYEADHPYAELCGALASAGLAFHVCPGTSSWNSLAGRPKNARANVALAAEEGLRHGAAGLLVTDWGDNGHLQPLPVSYPGLAAAASSAWNAGGEGDLGAALSAQAFSDRAGVLGPLLLELGDAQLQTGAPVVNGTFLFRMLLRPEPVPPAMRQRLLGAGLCAEGFLRAAARIDEVMTPLPAARSSRPDATQLADELVWAADALRLACELGQARLEAGLERPLEAVDRAIRAPLAVRLGPLVEQHRRLWLARSRPGGLDDSAARLEGVLAVLGGEGP